MEGSDHVTRNALTAAKYGGLGTMHSKDLFKLVTTLVFIISKDFNITLGNKNVNWILIFTDKLIKII